VPQLVCSSSPVCLRVAFCVLCAIDLADYVCSGNSMAWPLLQLLLPVLLVVLLLMVRVILCYIMLVP